MPNSAMHFLVKNTAVVYAFAAAITAVGLRRFQPYLASYWALILRLAKEQPLLLGPIVAMLPGYIVYSVSTQWAQIKGLFIQHFFAKVYLKNTDKNFGAIAKYMARRCEMCGAPPRTLRAETKKNTLSWVESWQQEMKEMRSGGGSAPKIDEMDYTTKSGQSLHVCFWDEENGSYFWMLNTFGMDKEIGQDRQPKELFEVEVSCWGGDSTPIRKMFQRALLADLSERKTKKGLAVYTNAQQWGNPKWEKVMTKKGREESSVVLEGDSKERILEDAQEFLDSKEWYSERGIPHRRGYLLYGPPGTGKTTFSQVIAHKLQSDICCISCNDKSLNDSSFAQLFRDSPQGAIMMLEDIDGIFKGRDKQGGAKEEGITFAGMLNALDGVQSHEGRIVIMTTNHKEVLDPALTRPGRVDFECELGHCTKVMAKQFFLNFYPSQEALAQQFIADFPDKNSSNSVSPAVMQQFFQRKEHKVDLDRRNDPLHEQEKAAVAVANRHRFDASESKREPEEIAVWAHLKRLGLEKYASVFESYGYFTKGACDELQFSDIENWSKDPSLELSFDRQAHAALKQWLDRSHPQRPKFEKNYALVTKHHIMHALQAQFPKEIPGTVEDCLRECDNTPTELIHEEAASEQEQVPKKLVRAGSRHRDEWAGLAQTAVHTLMHKEEDADGVKLVGRVSVLELKNHLSFYKASLREAVDTLEESLLNLRPEADVLRPMKLLDFLSRFGCEHTFHQIEDSRCEHISQLSSKLEKTAVEKDDQETIKAHLSPAELSARQADDFSIPDALRIVQILKSQYFRISDADTRRWVSALASKPGMSVFQLLQHIEKHSESPEAGLASIDDVFKVPEKPEVPEPVPPTGWVVEWLSGDEELSQYVDAFIGQKLVTKDDVLAEPPLDCGVLNDVLGINKLGHQKKLLIKIKQLRQMESINSPLQ